MKTLLTFAVLLMSAAAFAQDATCTTLYHHGDRDVILCRATVDGETHYSRQDMSAASASITSISEHTYNAMLEKDSADERAHISQVDDAHKKYIVDIKAITDNAERHTAAMKINSKKQCVAAGFAWSHGACSVKDGQ